MSTENAMPTREEVSAEQRPSLGERMMELRLLLAEGRITTEEYWGAVDAEQPP
jgi:hypothetical protein